MAYKRLQLRRGAQANLPTLSIAEFGYCTDTTKLYIGNGASNTRILTEADAIDVETYTATLGTTWASVDGYVTQTVTVSGILATDNPTIDLVTTTTGFEAEQEAWGKVFKAVTAANSITFYASEATETAINLQIKVVR